MTNDRRYELRGFELYLEGERIPVSTAVVRAVLHRRARENREPPPWDAQGRAAVDAETVKRILQLERAMAIQSLATLLKEKAA